ncbi:MAG: DUF2784 domain-containing protein [Thermoanaerobaculales bacterium]|nr:DUF2784 domain-containing protein [Thermoanaerobaculales bacterium]
MTTGLVADAVVLLHLAFILFVALGGLLVLRWPRLAWVHIPAVTWGAIVELTGWICPLTPMENRLRASAGDVAYTGGFIDRYIMPIVYPHGLTRGMQLVMAAAVVVVNLIIYGALVFRRHGRSSRQH